MSRRTKPVAVRLVMDPRGVAHSDAICVWCGRFRCDLVFESPTVAVAGIHSACLAALQAERAEERRIEREQREPEGG